MRSIERNKIAAAWLLMVLVIGFGHANGWLNPLEGDVDQEMYIRGGYPEVDDVFEVVYRVRLKEENSLNKYPEKMVAMGYVTHFSSRPMDPVTFITEKEIFVPVLNPGEWHEFSVKLRIDKIANDVLIQTGTRFKASRSGAPWGLHIYLLDPETGQYGTKEEWLKRAINVFWKYNNLEPQWLSEPDQEWEASNRKIAEEMRKFEPALTDSEALCLHEDNYKFIINAIGDSNATDDERIEHLLKAGWLEAQRSGAEAKEKWFNDFMEKNRGIWGGNSNLNFFRDNDSSGIDYAGNNSSSQERITTAFIGTWNYQDHIYNKDNGLLWSYAVKPVKTAEVGIRAYWYGQGQIFVGWGSTDNNGTFTITTELIPYGATNVRAFPLLYAWGPERFSEKIKVSNPSSQTWANPRDATIWRLARSDNPPANNVVPGGTCNFGVCYPETATISRPQPRSGSVNILETYFHARTFTSPPPTRPLRVMWEPGYDAGTAMNMLYTAHNDTVWVQGEAGSPYFNTDEWDDDVLLHEFGHYLMKGYAQGPPTCYGPHEWAYEYPDKPGIGYGEGWAHFFSGRARVGSGTDSLIVSTHYGTGGGAATITWFNLENPWDNTVTIPEFFDGGPWCEGAVAGALWDIYDSHNEIPYASYPDSLNGVWFPDTALADSLTMGHEEIWTVFDDYNPPGEPTNCWTIFHFRAGWNYYNYGHQFALNQILLHHRIRDSIPAAPIGLSANQEGKYVRLYWNKNSESDLKGYRVYRRMYNKTWGHWDDWAWRADKDSPTDTTYLDSKVISTVYRYRVTACDSLGNESDYSDSVQISVKNGIEPEGIQLFSRSQTIFSNVQGMEISIPQESKEITFKIYDCCGRIVNKQKIKLTNCDLLKINLRDAKNNHLPNGVYFLHLKTDNGDEAMRKFVVIR